MNTATAIVGHGVIGAAQAGAVMAGPAIPWWGQLLIQLGLLFGQGFLAHANSNTNPDGTPATQPFQPLVK